jgi:hypothetical protein
MAQAKAGSRDNGVPAIRKHQPWRLALEPLSLFVAREQLPDSGGRIVSPTSCATDSRRAAGAFGMPAMIP